MNEEQERNDISQSGLGPFSARELIEELERRDIARQLGLPGHYVVFLESDAWI